MIKYENFKGKSFNSESKYNESMDRLLEVLEWVYNVPSPLMDSKDCLDKIMEEYGRIRNKNG